MNKFLYSILKNVCKQLNEYLYTTVDYGMFKECIYLYQNIKKINPEKERILMHLDAIKADCDALAMDVERSLRLKDTVENDSIADFSISDVRFVWEDNKLYMEWDGRSEDEKGLFQKLC